MFFNHLIDAAKQKAASIKWENARTMFDVRIGIRIRIRIRIRILIRIRFRIRAEFIVRTGRTDGPVMGSNTSSSTR